MKDYKLREMSSEDTMAHLREGLQEMYQEFEGEVLRSITEIVDYAKALEQDKIDLIEFLYDVLRAREEAKHPEDTPHHILTMLEDRAGMILDGMGAVRSTDSRLVEFCTKVLKATESPQTAFAESPELHREAKKILEGMGELCTTR